MKTYGSVAVLLCVILFTSCTALNARSQTDKPQHTVESVQHGRASWYSIGTNGGTRTASGRRLSNDAATAAHKTLPLGSTVKITNKNNGKSEIVTITDRGPYARGRIIDVTIGTAKRLGFVRSGTAPVKIEVLTSAKSRK